MRRIFLAAGVLLALAGAAIAQPFETPEALLEAFYEPYFTDEFPEDESAFRSAALNALYAADAENTPLGEMGALGFDPYVDGQDYQLADLVIDAAEISGDAASVAVSFTNFGRPTALTYELVHEGNGWKIDDVVSSGGEYPYRLSDIFAAALGGE
ncbi:DUF3828 domain-containing protein [Devosia elaeis]|uniref:DUF3828 domain-containing protein n=1 Tax=Devosia elaeis TaxID=1770058 RepID=A0A178I4F5_9HYPH|nr:DUF3828 domain-containing protein [Devosia elaeis]OAM79174.1 hypothetical protein A3840_03630 [Devosia elaeis]